MSELLRSRLTGLAIAILVAMASYGCSEVRGPKAGPEPAGAKAYEVKGTVVSLDAGHRKVRITHEEIPGYMAKMTMDFEVRDSSDLGALGPGDTVSFRMKVTEADGWIETVRRIGRSGGPTNLVSELAPASSPTNGIGDMRRVRRAEPLFPGDALPEFTLTNEFGKAVSFESYKGQAVAFTFFFTTCPFPTMCPRMSTNLRDAYRLLKASPNFPTNWHFFSITIDPSTDTPSVLGRYASKYQYDPGHWSFLTGANDDIDALGRHFGLQFYRENGALNHNLRTVVINPRGRVQKILIGNEWTPEELETEIRAALTGAPPP